MQDFHETKTEYFGAESETRRPDGALKLVLARVLHEEGQHKASATCPAKTLFRGELAVESSVGLLDKPSTERGSGR